MIMIVSNHPPCATMTQVNVIVNVINWLLQLLLIVNSPSAQKVSAKFTQVTSKDLRSRHQPKRGRRPRDNKVQDAYESSKWKKQWPRLLGAVGSSARHSPSRTRVLKLHASVNRPTPILRKKAIGLDDLLRRVVVPNSPTLPARLALR